MAYSRTTRGKRTARKAPARRSTARKPARAAARPRGQTIRIELVQAAPNVAARPELVSGLSEMGFMTTKPTKSKF